MTQHVTFHIHAHNQHGVLQRMLLLFSRRRLRIEALQMFDLKPDRPAEIQVDLACEESVRRDLLAQLQRIVEVSAVWSEVREAEVEAPLELASA